MKKLVFGAIIAGSTVVSLTTVFFFACGSTPAAVGGGSQGGGGVGGSVTINTGLGANGGSGSGSGGTGTSGASPTADANCGSQTSGTSRVPADVLLVLDRSASMDYSTSADSNCRGGATGCTARWPALTSAVTSTLNATASSINWGLKFFSSPGGGVCTVNSGADVPISATSVPTIESQIAATQPANDTPTAQAITAATAYLKQVNDSNNKFILLATDGEPNCSAGNNTASNVPATVTAITAAKAAGFAVYVIGIGPSVGNLDSFAQAGGTGTYFPATTPQALTDAFTAISRAVTTCTFVLATTPPDLNNVDVYLDGDLVPQSSSDGWSYGANNQTVVLKGSYCTQITSGQASKVQVLFGCPGQAPPSTIPIF
jgi:hypothetical protein